MPRDDFSEFPQDRCERCGAVIGKDEQRDDVCDACLAQPEPFGMCADDDATGVAA